LKEQEIVMNVSANKKLAACMVFVLPLACLAVESNSPVLGFDPFAPGEANVGSLPHDTADTSPIIPEIQFSNDEIYMAFQMISDITGWSIVHSSAVGGAEISLSAKDITAQELLDSVVTVVGFLYHRQGNIITVVTYDEYMQYYGLAKQVIPLAYADAGSVAAAIKPFLTKLGRLVVHKETNTVVLYEVDANLESVAGIIGKLDTPAEDIGVEVINLRYADCESLAGVLQQVFAGQKKMITNRGQAAADTTEKAAGKKARITAPDTVKELLVPYEQVGIYAVLHANQLVVVGTKSDVEKVRELVAKIDVFGADMVLEVIDLKYADSEVVATTLQEIFGRKEPEKITESGTKVTTEREPIPSRPSPGVGVEIKGVLFTPKAQVEVYSIGRTNQLIVKAFRSDIGKVKELVAKLDVFVEPTTRSYHFVYVDAAEVYQGLEQILDIYSRYGGSYGGAGQVSGGRAGYGKESGLTLVERTNTILLTGPPSAHRIMQSIHKSVDQPGKYEAGMIRVYKIQNGDVAEIAETVRAIIETREREEKPGEARFAEPTEAAPPAAGPGPTAADMEATEEFVPQIEGKVSVNTATNSIVVQTTARLHRQIEQLIKELDIRRKQVLIKAMILVVTTSDDMDLGVELGYFDGDLISFTSFGLSQIDPATGARDIIVGPGGTAAVLEPDKLQVLVRALESNDNMRIESAPQVLVNDNAVGLIQSISEEPFKQASQGQATTITSFGGFVEAGTQFAITPHISDHGYLRVEYQITLNAFTEKADPTLPPPRNTSTIQSEATVPDGSTIVVGGIQSSIESESIDKVPLLGDIPILGWAFKNTVVRKEYRTTYLFITPAVMKSEGFDDLIDISEKTLGKVNQDGTERTLEPEA
jgi:type II secretory pathway component GspD/PulD (secretin)